MKRDTASQTKKRRYAPRLPVEERREHLLDATLRVLVREGYDKVTVEAIAQEAGVSRPVVYGAYDGLEPLLHALLDRTQRRALAAAIRLMPPGGVPEDVDAWLLEAAGGMVDAVRADPDTWRPVLGLTSGAPAVVRERIENTRDLLRGYIADALASGLEQRGGPFLDVEVLAHLVMVTAEEFGRLVLEDPPRYEKERLVSALAGLLAAAPPRD